MRARLVRCWPLLALAILTAVYYWDFLAGRSFLWEDGLQTNYPAARYLCRSLWSGEFPFWAPGISDGFAFYADPQMGAFYPLNWLLLPFARDGLSFLVYQRFIVAQIFLGGALFYGFLRGGRLRPLASLSGAVVFAFSGFMSLHFKHVGMVQALIWVPLELLLIRKLARSFTAARFAGLLAALSLSLLGGHTQVAAYGFLVAAAYWVYRLAALRRLSARTLGLAGAAFIVTALLNAYLILPAYEGYRRSWRVGWEKEVALDQSLPLYHLTALLAPNFFGTSEDRPVAMPYWGYDRGSREVLKMGGGRWQYWEFGAYAGQAAVLAVLVVFLGLNTLRRRREAAFFAGLWVFALLYMLGRHAGLAALLERLIPFFASFRVPARMALALDLSFAALTAYLVDALEAREAVPALGPSLLLAGLGLVFAFSPPLPTLADAPAAALAARAGNASLQMVLALSFLAYTLACVWAAMKAKTKGVRRAALIALTVMIFGDLRGAYGRFHRGTIDPDEHFADRAGLAAKLKAQGPLRVGQAVDGRSASDVLLPRNFPLVEPGLELVDGETTFNAAGIEAFHALRDEEAKRDLQNVGVQVDLESKSGRLSIDGRARALPRAKFYADIKGFASREALLSALDDKTLNYRKTAGVVGDWPRAKGKQPAGGDVVFARIGSGAYALDYSVPAPGVIFVSEAFYPGWEVSSGAKVIETFGAFQGIVIDKPGRGTLTVRFKPRSFRLGLLLSALTALVLTSALALRRRASLSLP